MLAIYLLTDLPTYLPTSIAQLWIWEYDPRAPGRVVPALSFLDTSQI